MAALVVGGQAADSKSRHGTPATVWESEQGGGQRED